MTLIEGDGIGPEISGAVVKVLAAAKVGLSCDVVVAGSSLPPPPPIRFQWTGREWMCSQ